MTKKWLMYAVTGLLCCGIIGFAVAKQIAKPTMTARDRAKLELTQINEQMLKVGQTQELAARQTELQAGLDAATNLSNKSSVDAVVAPTNVAKEANTDANRALISNKAPKGYVATAEPVQSDVQELNLDKARIGAALERLAAGQGVDYNDKMLLEDYFAMMPTTESDRNPLDAQGGPSAFGYRWVDNLGGDTATYAWEEPSAPIELTTISSSDDAAQSVPFGFNFPYYGGTYASGFASTNGVLSLDVSFTSWSNTCPRYTSGGVMIFPYFDDGNTSTGASSDGGRVVYQQYADHVTITWDSVGTCCTSGNDRLDYQLQLWNNGKIKMQYRQIQHLAGGVGNGSSPLIGIQQSGTLDFLNYYCNTVGDSAYTNALDGRAIWFYLGAANLHDYRAVSVVSPSPLRVEPNAVFNLIGRFTNFGSTTEAAPVKYTFNGGPVVSENTAALAQFASEDHDWAGTLTAPGVVGDYVLTMYSDLATDEIRSNDTLRVNIEVRTCTDEAITAPGSWTDTVLGDECTLRTGPDYTYAVTIPNDGEWSFSLCGGATWDTYLYLTSSCCGTIIASNDDGCGTLQSLLSCQVLTAGTYYLTVETFGGTGDVYTLNITECVPCVIPCGPFDIPEVAEFEVCNHDSFDANGGCNNANGVALFQDIACGDTVCGQMFTYLNCDGFQYRDTDWYRLTLTETMNVSWSIIGEYRNALGFIIADGCQVINIVGQAGPAPECNTLITTSVQCLPPGEYYLWVGVNAFDGLPYSADYDYRAWVDCTPCDQTIGRCCYNGGSQCADVIETNCINLGGLWDPNLTCTANPCDNLCLIDCGAFDVIEAAEFDVCNHDSFDVNGGCNNAGGNQLFQDVACGDTVCGHTFTYLNCSGFEYRDTDWYRFTLTESQDVTWTMVAEFPNALGFIISGGCAGLTIEAQAGPAASCGQVITATATCLPPGEYYLWASANQFNGLPFADDLKYRAWVDCSAPTNCPVGRCCYNEGVDCIDNFADECFTLGGDWDPFSTCAAGPCPIPVDNDDCATAAEIVVVPNGTASVVSGAEGATPTCTDVCDYTSSGPDQFYYFTLTECRLIAIMADPNDPHISVYEDGQCCGAAILCNDDWGNNLDLDTYLWLPPTTRPTANFGSMVADSLPAGTYYIRAGHYGTGWGGDYTLSLMDFGPCQLAPCDPIVDLAAFVGTAGGLADHIELFFTAPQDDDYKIWSTTNPNHDGNPNDGADPDWTLVATLPGLLAGPQQWIGPVGFSNYLNFVVTAVCEPFVAPTGRCCYGDFQCADVTEAECADLAGTWTQFQTCVNNPCPPPPAGNDNCADAVEVLNGVPVAGDNLTATNDWVATCTFDTYDVWYYYVATTTNPITVELCDPTFSFDTTINVLFETCGSTEVACNDDSGTCTPNTLQSSVTFTPASTGTYLIRVAGFSSNVGTFVLTVTQ